MILFGKPIINWELEDLQLIINNPDYKESEYIDYKRYFSYLKIPKTNTEERQKKKNEFRNDICSFANSDGGYLIYGMSEDKGIPISIDGVEIIDNDTEKFENNLRKDFSFIEPIVPSVSFKFIQLDNGNYIITLKIEKGLHIPYVNIVNNTVYRYYKREGANNRPMRYKEVRAMYNESLNLSSEIKKFRENRHDFLRENSMINPLQYAIVNIIPSTFIDKSTDLQPYLLQMKGKFNYESEFKNCCYGDAIPNLDGLCYIAKESNIIFQVYNNNIVEKTIEIITYHNERMQQQLRLNELSSSIEELTNNAIKYYKKIGLFCKAYICVSVFGCRNLISQYIIQLSKDFIGVIDRHMIICEPIEIYDINSEENVKASIKSQKIALSIALGIKNLGTLIEE